MSGRRPNIIIFNPDQFRTDGLSHMGQPGTSTPVLDEMVATEAMSFSDAYCQNPVCTPSRCSFMTGLYPHVFGHRTMEHMLHDENNEISMLRILKENGWNVWWGGKNDLLPGQGTWKKDADFKYVPSAEDLEKLGVKRTVDLHRDTEWRGEKDGDNWYSFHAGVFDRSFPEFCDSDWLNIWGAVDFIRNYDSEKPFCIFLPLSCPHPPYGVEKEFMENIDRDALWPRRPDIKDGEFGSKAAILKGIRKGQHMQDWTEDMYRDMRATYYGMCARTDHHVGMVRDAMKEKGLWDDSLFLFFSDHGDYTGDYGISEKNQNTFEDPLVNVPLIIKLPESDTERKNGKSPALAELTDVTATVWDYTGIEPPYWSFGKSLLPVLEGKTERHRDAVFSEGGRLKGEESANEHNSLKNARTPEDGLYYPRIILQQQEDPILHGKATMIRTDKYKLVRRLYEEDEFYDLEKDPTESDNRIRDPEYREIITELRLRMLEWYQATCDTVPFIQDERNFR